MFYIAFLFYYNDVIFSVIKERKEDVFSSYFSEELFEKLIENDYLEDKHLDY